VRALVLLLALLPPADLVTDLKKDLAAADPAARIAALDALAPKLADAPAAERKAAARLLLRILADDDEERLHPACLGPLVATAEAGAVRAVLARFYSREPTILKAVAAEALAGQGGAAVTEILADFLRQDRSPRARAHLALLLGRRGDRSAGAVLVEALSDPEPMVRSAAAESLTRLHGECLGFDPAAWKEAVKRGLRGPRADPGPGPKVARGPLGETVTASPAPRDPEVEVGRLEPQFFGIALDRPVVVVVLDFSGSVRRRGGEAVKAHLGKALGLLPTTTRFTVLAFDERILPLVSEPSPADPDLKEELASFLDDLPPGQRTELLLPVRTGLELARKNAGKEGAQVLIVSDGAPTVDGPPLRDLIDRARGLPDAGVRVDVAVHGGGEVSLFRYLVKLTGGKYVALPSPR
jgi:hypothetical protein